jgi:hypothetical protein
MKEEKGGQYYMYSKLWLAIPAGFMVGLALITIGLTATSGHPIEFLLLVMGALSFTASYNSSDAWWKTGLAVGWAPMLMFGSGATSEIHVAVWFIETLGLAFGPALLADWFSSSEKK